MESNRDEPLIDIKVYARDDGPEIVAGMQFTEQNSGQIGQVLGMVNSYVKKALLNIYKNIERVDQAVLIHSFFEEFIDPNSGEAQFYLRTIPDDKPDATDKPGDPEAQ